MFFIVVDGVVCVGWMVDLGSVFGETFLLGIFG